MINFGGYRIIEDENMSDPVVAEGYRECPRHPCCVSCLECYGLRKFIVWVPRNYAATAGDRMIMHPIFAAKVRAALRDNQNSDMFF